MEAAWKYLAHSASQLPVSSESFSKNSAEEKHATKREREFVSMLASNMSKVSIFREWQIEQLEGLVPMARLHSIISNCVDKFCFDDSDESNIVLGKLKSKQFETHRKICYPEYIRRIGLSKRTIVIVLDGELRVHGKHCNKHLTKGNCTVISRCVENIPASSSSESLDSKATLQDPTSLEFDDLSYTSHHAFFMTLSEAAVESVAPTTIMSSKIEFSLHRDTAIRSQAITLDSICHTTNCETKVFYPGEMQAASDADGKIRIIVCGHCIQKQGENLAARLKDTCNSRQIAQSEELSLSQAVFFAIHQKRAVLNACMKLKQKNRNITQIRHDDDQKNPFQESDLQHGEISFLKKDGGISEKVTHFLNEISTEKCERDIPATKYQTNAERRVANPFMMMLPAFCNDEFEGTLPQSPAVRGKKSKLQISHANSQVLLPGFIHESAASCPEPAFPYHAKAHIISGGQITKKQAFWGYTPALQKPLSNAKFYWALIRLFVHSCATKVRSMLRKGESLDMSPVCSVRGRGRKGQSFHKFLTLSVVYTIPFDEAILIFNPFLHTISRVVSWHDDLCSKPYFRSADNVEKIMAGTCNLKCFSRIPQATRRLVFANCSFEEWQPGALILCNPLLIYRVYCFYVMFCN